MSVLLILTLLVSACSTKPHVLKQTSIQVESGEKIYVVRHGLHTGFVIPAETIQSLLPGLSDRFGDVPYLEIGWGDKAYYEAEDVTIGLTLRAVLWPTDSVIHAVGVPERPDIYFADKPVESLCLDKQQYAALVAFMEQSFEKDENGVIIPSKSGNYGDSQFFEGIGEYYMFNTCNTWLAKGLKSTGRPITPVFKVTAGNIMSYVSRHSRCITPPEESLAGNQEQ
jgi:uncharacterized protein (TIGR02117 family)